MATKINYTNKTPFQTREDIPDENKVNAEDMNEIKTAVNNNADELDTAKGDIENLQSGQGTANTDITSLKNRVNTLESDNKTNKSDISSLKTDNETNKSDIEDLQTDNETNKTNITNLQNDKVDKVEGKDLSTNDFTTELKTKLEGLENYDDTEIKEDISNLEAGQTEQDKQIDMLINALPTETQEAENINLKGTIPVKFKEFKLSGNSKQETSDTMPSPEYPSEIQNVEGDVNVSVANKEGTEQQVVTFPLSEGQKLYKGDYLASDGIHHVRKQMELDGTEDWALALTNTDTLTFQIVNNNLPVKIPNDNDEIVMISNYFKGFSRNQFNNDKETESISPNSSNGSKAIIITINKTTAENLNDFKSWLAAQKQAGTPVIIEYKLAEEEIEAYTPEQQEAYNQLCNLKAYEGSTNVYSTNEISPIFKVTAIKDINSVITQLNTVLLERS